MLFEIKEAQLSRKNYSRIFPYCENIYSNKDLYWYMLKIRIENFIGLLITQIVLGISALAILASSRTVNDSHIKNGSLRLCL